MSQPVRIVDPDPESQPEPKWEGVVGWVRKGNGWRPANWPSADDPERAKAQERLRDATLRRGAQEWRMEG